MDDRASPSRDQLTRLLLEVVSDERLDSELLARFARAPESLSRAEREGVERFLKAHPQHQMTIRVAGSFTETTSESPSRPAGGHSIRRALGVWLWPRGVGIVAGAGVAAAVAIALVLERERDPAERALEPTPTISSVPRAIETQSSRARPERSTATPSDVSEATEPTLPRAIASTEDQAPSVALESTRDRAERPYETTTPDPAEVEPRLVASVVTPRYQRPAQSADRTRLASVVRSQTASVELEALAPAHVARTLSPSPTLYWSLRSLPTRAGRFSLTLVDPERDDPLLEAELPAPERAGLQSVALRAFGVELPAGVEIVWSISFSREGNDASRARRSSAWIEHRVAAAPEAETLSDTPLHERAAAYAASGFWYDALNVLVELADAYPTDPSVRSALTSLLGQAGLDAPAIAP